MSQSNHVSCNWREAKENGGARILNSVIQLTTNSAVRVEGIEGIAL
jgi:hypothetical protein